jgi:hypothetical protein
MDNVEEQKRAEDNFLPVHTLEDLSRADLGSARVVKMVINDAIADRAEELQERTMPGGGQGGQAPEAMTGTAAGGGPFHSGGEQGDIRRKEE